MEKRTVGIITLLSLNSVNYGNHLQAYALNKYINKNYSTIHAVTLLIKDGSGIKFTTIDGCIKYYSRKIKRKLYWILYGIKNVEKRLDRFKQFTSSSTVISERELTNADICKSNYDVLIVGSDVVWYQTPGVIDLLRYLPFNKNTKQKYSYAASFGNEAIPQENKKTVEKYLSKFDKIAVRESSAIKILSEVGIDEVTHTCDPTLLLTSTEWRSISQKPKMIGEQNIEEYAFAYFLGNSEQQIEKVRKYFEKQGIRLLYIPYSNGLIRKNQSENIDLIDCSPQEWIWLIDNAKYVVTDSFHGLAFSVIFEKKFVAIKRVYTENINSRIIDLLKTISAENKLIDIDDIDKTDMAIWESGKYMDSVKNFIESSKRYLNTVIGE